MPSNVPCRGRGDAFIDAHHFAHAIFALVPLIVNAGRPRRANISLDAGLLEAIDEAATRNGLTRSAFLATAAIEKIKAGA